MEDDCFLGKDFLKIINLENVFDSIFGTDEFGEGKVSRGSRVIGSSGKVPPSLENLFLNNSKDLNESQKGVFVNFFDEFQDVFSKEIVAGNCELVKYEINVKDSPPIKQIPRRILIHLRKEVNEIFVEMRSRTALGFPQPF